jgi:thiol-disulfide isomerase/thioredoxin
MIVPHGLIEALLATASDAIIATDHTGIVNFWNPWCGADFRSHG